MPARYFHWIIIALVFILIIPFLLFYDLGGGVLQIWDEARRGVNAFEMLRNGNLLVSHYEGMPDMWGTKPSLLVAIQAGMMGIFGPGELAVRFPSALAGLMTCIFVVYFSAKYLGKPWLGLIWSIVLVSCNGYVDMHGTRTGDFDALLTLFMFLYSLFFFLYTETKEPKFLLYTALFVTLATLTKGIAGLLFMPGLLIWAFATRSVGKIITARKFWIGAGMFILLVGGYYLAREMLNPGYINAVTRNELGGRYLNTLEDHNYGFTFYIKFFYHTRLGFWFWLLIPAILAGFFVEDRRHRHLHIFGILLFVNHLLIISSSQTRLRWYDLPEYPYIALILANLMWFVVEFFFRIFRGRNKAYSFLCIAVFLILVLFQPVQNAFKEVIQPLHTRYYFQNHEISEILKEGVTGERDLDSYRIVHQGYFAHCLFYQYLLLENGLEVKRVQKTTLQVGEKVLTDEEEVQAYIESQYQVDLLEKGQFIKIYQIIKPL